MSKQDSPHYKHLVRVRGGWKAMTKRELEGRDPYQIKDPQRAYRNRINRMLRKTVSALDYLETIRLTRHI